MKRTFSILAGVATLAALLAGCFIVDDGFTPAPRVDGTVTAGTVSSRTVTRLGPLDNNSSVLYEINVPTGLRQAEMLHVELNQNVLLELLDSGERVIAASRSRTHFGPTLASLQGVTEMFAPQSVEVRPACVGSCILHPPRGQGSFYARVTNQSGVPMAVELTVYVEPFADNAEPNNTPATATVIGSGTVDESGAIEILGDVDYWRFSEPGQIYFDGSFGADLRASIVDSAGNEVGDRLQAGDSFPVFTGEILKVWSPSGLAGNAHGLGSLYFLYTDTGM